MPNTARGAFPYPLGGDTPDVPRDILALANRLAAAGVLYAQGTLAARPAANSMGGSGFFYFATDNGLMYYSDGAAWVLISPTSAAQQFLDAPGAGVFQQGVLGQTDGRVTRLDPVSVRVAATAAGSPAWIDGDGVAGVGSGRYPASWVQTDLTGIPAAGVGMTRFDRVIVRLTGNYGAVPSIERLAGVEAATAGVSHTTRAGAAAIPAGCLLLADFLVDNAGVRATSIRDRRSYARGFYRVLKRKSNAAAADDYTYGGGTWASIDAVNIDPFLIAEHKNPLEIRLIGFWQCASAEMVFSFYPNGVGFEMRTAHGITTNDGTGKGSQLPYTMVMDPADYAGVLGLGGAAGEESVHTDFDPSWYHLSSVNMRLLARNSSGYQAVFQLREHRPNAFVETLH